MACDTLGRWRVQAKSSQVNKVQDCGTDPGLAFKTADGFIKQLWPDSMRIVDGSANWHQAKPSEKQVALLKQLGISETVIAACDRGRASMLITRQLQARQEGKNGRR